MSSIAPPVHGNTVSQRKTKETTHSHRVWLEGLRTRLRFQISNDSVSFMASLTVHVLLILILALIAATTQAIPHSLLLVGSDKDMAFLDVQLFNSSNLESERGESSSTSPENNLTLLAIQHDVAVLTPTETEPIMPQITVNSLLPSTMIASSNTVSLDALKSNSAGLFASSSLEGRSPENRHRLAKQNGGTKESEDAVDAALVWLAAHQSQDGSWSTDLRDKPCNARCTHGTEEIGSPKRVAATGLAILCFLGAGHTHRQGLYREEVTKGIHYLTSTIKKGPPNARDSRSQGRFLRDGAPYEMYEHGIAVLALCEACEMTKDTMLIEPCTSGIDFITKAQHSDGSWGYTPNVSGDLSIVGWQMMALKSASKLAIRVQPEVIAKVDKFLDSQQSEYGSYYGYRSTQKDPCMTGIGLLLRLYRGWSKTEPRIDKGAQYIADLGPSTNGIYYNYYATQLLFHIKHAEWPVWNQTNRDFLVREQAKEGHEKGSWYFGRSHFNQVGGRLYCTTMSVLTLEVYYRFMPIYSELSLDDFQL